MDVSSKDDIWFRPATSEDSLIVADIHASSWANNYHRVLTAKYLQQVVPTERIAIWTKRLEQPKPNQRVVVAENQEEIVGFTCVYLDGNPRWGSYLDNLHVRPSYQSSGIGKRLIIAAAQLCVEQADTSGMCLIVNQDNEKAQDFYLHMGGRRAEVDVWNAPDGSVVPIYRFVWDNVEELLKRAKN